MFQMSKKTLLCALFLHQQPIFPSATALRLQRLTNDNLPSKSGAGNDDDSEMEIDETTCGSNVSDSFRKLEAMVEGELAEIFNGKGSPSRNGKLLLDVEALQSQLTQDDKMHFVSSWLEKAKGKVACHEGSSDFFKFNQENIRHGSWIKRNRATEAQELISAVGQVVVMGTCANVHLLGSSIPELVEALPYGGDVQKAQTAGDKKAIVQIFRHRNKMQGAAC